MNGANPEMALAGAGVESSPLRRDPPAQAPHSGARKVGGRGVDPAEAPHPLNLGAGNGSAAKRAPAGPAPLPAGEAGGVGGGASDPARSARPRADTRTGVYQASEAQPLVNIANRITPGRSERRKRTYRLRNVAARLLPDERVAMCGRRPHLSHVDVRCGDCGASYVGLETCGSVWTCPVCGTKIAEERRREIRALVEQHCRNGGTVYMCAFTLAHSVMHSARDLRKAVAGSFQRMLAGASWKRALAKAGCIGGIRTLEVTVGRNGWHPHIHATFWFDHSDEARAAEFGIWLFQRWARIVARAGFGRCNPEIWRFERAAHYDAVIDYVVKGNFDMELTRGHMKLAKGGGRSPWQLLDDAAHGDRRAERQFREFAAAFKGARQLTWFGCIRELKSDLELANVAEPGGIIGSMKASVFVRVSRAGLTAQLLDAAEADGWVGVLAFLTHENLYDPAASPHA